MGILKDARDIDVHVGGRIRRRRKDLRLKQQDVARIIGTTSQQLSKYEHGQNRVGASRLQHLAEILQIPVPWFFADDPIPGKEPARRQISPLRQFMTSQEGLELNKAFASINDPTLRKGIVDIVTILAAME